METHKLYRYKDTDRMMMILAYTNESMLIVDDIMTSMTHFAVLPYLHNNALKTHTSVVTDKNSYDAAISVAKEEVIKRLPVAIACAFRPLSLYAELTEKEDSLYEQRPRMLMIDDNDFKYDAYFRIDVTYIKGKLNVEDAKQAIRMLVGCVCIRGVLDLEVRQLHNPAREYIYMKVDKDHSTPARYALNDAAAFIQRNFENNGISY